MPAIVFCSRAWPAPTNGTSIVSKPLSGETVLQDMSSIANDYGMRGMPESGTILCKQAGAINLQGMKENFLW